MAPRLRPVLVTASISILILLYLDMQVLIIGDPKKGRILYKDKENINRNTTHDRTLENDLKLWNNRNELLFKSNSKDKHEREIISENEVLKTERESETKLKQDHSSVNFKVINGLLGWLLPSDSEPSNPSVNTNIVNSYVYDLTPCQIDEDQKDLVLSTMGSVVGSDHMKEKGI